MSIKADIFFSEDELTRLQELVRHRYKNVENSISLFFEEMIIQAFVGVNPLLQQKQWMIITLSAKEISCLAKRLSEQQLKLQEWTRKQLWKALIVSGVDPTKTSYNTDSLPALSLKQIERRTERQQAVSIHAELSGVLESLSTAIGIEKDIILWTAILSAVPEYFFAPRYDYRIAIGLDMLEHKWLEQIGMKFGIEVKTDVLKRIITI